MNQAEGLTLERMIAPVDLPSFRKEFEERKALIASGDTRRFSGLVTFADIEARLLFSPDFDRPALHMNFHGYTISDRTLRNSEGLIDYAKVMRHYRGGATLIVIRVERFSNRVLHLTRDIERHLECGVHGNLYATPAGSKAYQPHGDGYDVFAAQLDGAKNWKLYDQPLRLYSHHLGGDDVDWELGELQQAFTLQAGDAIYLPRGLVHEAATPPERISTHLTIGLHRYYWHEFLHDMIVTAAREDIDFRHALPAGALSSGIDLRERGGELLNRLRDRFPAGAAMDRFRRIYPKLGQASGIRCASADDAEELPLNSPLRLCRDPDPQITMTRQGAAVNLSYRDAPLPIRHPFVPDLELALSGETFTPNNFRSVQSEREKRLFAYYLMNNGIIERIQS